MLSAISDRTYIDQSFFNKSMVVDHDAKQKLTWKEGDIKFENRCRSMASNIT